MTEGTDAVFWRKRIAGRERQPRIFDWIILGSSGPSDMRSANDFSCAKAAPPHVSCPGRGPPHLALLRRAGTHVLALTVGPGSAAHHAAKAARRAAAGERRAATPLPCCPARTHPPAGCKISCARRDRTPR